MQIRSKVLDDQQNSIVCFPTKLQVILISGWGVVLYGEMGWWPTDRNHVVERSKEAVRTNWFKKLE